MSKVDKMRTPELATACQVIKAACQKVLQTSTTFGFSYTSATKGRFSVCYESETSPTPTQVQEVDKVCNALIAEDLPIKVTVMKRKEAEDKYTTSIYDLLKPPEEVQELNILEIEGYVTNAVKAGDFLPSTGKLNGITINSINFRPQKQHVEFLFTLLTKDESQKKGGPVAKAGSGSSGKGKAASKDTFFDQVKEGEKKNTAPLDPSEQLASYLFNEMAHIDVNSEEGKKKLRELFIHESRIMFNHIRNTSYAEGLKAIS
jgi:alanyl-tRNA synthetase